MKRTKSKNATTDFQKIFLTFFPVITALSVFIFSTGIINKNITVFFAGLSMPYGYGNLILDDLVSTVNSSYKNASAGDSGNIVEVNSPSKNRLSAKKGLTDTPEDILKLMSEATAVTESNAKGKITEKQYDNSSATHSYGNVFVRNTTKTQQSLNVKNVLSQKVDLTIKDKKKPTVLIFHTHTTETYEILNSGFYSGTSGLRNDDLGRNMVRVGDEIVEQLEDAGFAVIHDRNIYDKSYNGSYDRSAESIKKYKAQYPDLQVIIDVHRDAIQLDNGTRIKPTATINGKKAAQVMIISGCQEQNITDFKDWQYNLRFALNLQKKCEDLFPGLMRPIFFCARKYNMNSSHCSVLIEVGSNSNTLEEAVYSGKLIGIALSSLLEDHVVK